MKINTNHLFSIQKPPFLSNCLRFIGRLIPNIKYIRAIPNRILKPINSLLGFRGPYIVKIDEFYMCLLPEECVDGNLYFSAHLYDRKEILFLLKRFPKDGVLIDAGAYKGYWSLKFACRYPNAMIYAIEPNPYVFDVLKFNIKINGYKNIVPINLGLSDNEEELYLHLNLSGNLGGSTFREGIIINGDKIKVKVAPLLKIINEFNIEKIDILKLDIEGFEPRVLSKFFSQAPKHLYPKYIVLEMHFFSITDLPYEFQKNYRVVLKGRENWVFQMNS